MGGGKFFAWFAAVLVLAVAMNDALRVPEIFTGAFVGVAIFVLAVVAALPKRSRQHGKPSRLRKAWQDLMRPLPPEN